MKLGRLRPSSSSPTVRAELEADEAAIRAKYDAYMINAGKFFRRIVDAEAQNRWRQKEFWQPVDTEANRDLMREYQERHNENLYQNDSYKFSQASTRPVEGALPLNISNFGAVGPEGVQKACDVIVMKGKDIIMGQRVDQTDLWALFGGLSENGAAMKAMEVMLELYDEAIASALTEKTFYQNLINAIPQDNDELVRLLEGVTITDHDNIFAAFQAKCAAVKQKHAENEQKERTELAKLQRQMIGLAEKVKKEQEPEYKDMPTLLRESLKRVTDSTGHALTVGNNTDHRTGQASTAQSDIYYIDLENEALTTALRARGITLELKAGDDMRQVKAAHPTELFKHTWGEHGNIVFRTIKAFETKAIAPECESKFASHGRKRIEFFKKTEEGLKTTVERTATRLLNMLVDNANYEKAHQPSYGEGMFSRKKSFKALDYINQQRAQQVSDVEILNHILTEGSTRSGGKYQRSLGLLEAAVPQYTKAETGQTGRQFLQAVMGSHPACQPKPNQSQRSVVMPS